ncbi:hypothetical protein [Neisseria weixii]|uniref:hypothetical protein n=1 Tax=Neisseria weixii TaxID=1853276 RepID=UPI000BB6917B|nr:hypothetical protein [Neisseria weixii]ATD64965.1 hypothetical protein CGZ65_05840 [Neisseria weixii]
MNYSWDDYESAEIDNMADAIIDEYAGCRIATKAQLTCHRNAVIKRLQALEEVLWQRYEELVSRIARSTVWPHVSAMAKPGMKRLLKLVPSFYEPIFK